MTDTTDKNADVDIIDVASSQDALNEGQSGPDKGPNRAPEKSSGGGFVWLLAAVVVMAGGGYAVWPYVGNQAAPYVKEARTMLGFQGRPTQPTLPKPAQPERPSPVTPSPVTPAPATTSGAKMPPVDIPAVETPVAAAPEPMRVSPVEAPVQVQAPLGNLDRRIAQLESQAGQNQSGADVAPILNSFVARLDVLEAQLNAALNDGGSTDGQTALDATSHLARTLEQITAQLATLNTRLGALENAPRSLIDPSASAQALVLAVSQLQTQAGNAAAFSGDLDALERIGSADPFIAAAVARLRPHASLGVASLTVLNAEFKTMAANVMRAHRRSDRGGWWSEVTNAMGSLVSVRRTDPARIDDEVERALAIAERALGQNDLHTAVAALRALQGPQGPQAPPAQAANPWRNAA
ncbi:MAG: hypothetical protein JKY27_04870, partial [Magnetovibrio sp.]|nr:hypothetical protein [Magnetovibrio sp.]